MAEEMTNANYSEYWQKTQKQKNACGHVFSCIQYKSRIMYYTICIEIFLLFIGINKYLSREMFKKNIKWYTILFDTYQKIWNLK